ncbi:MAG: RidA family protein [Acidobacteriota bacterium]
MLRTAPALLLIPLFILAAAVQEPAEKKKKRRQKKEPEEITQVLALPKEPPATVIAESQRLSFHVSPLSGQGLLSPQVRDALRSLFRQVRGAAIVKLRAFVAGTGDLRRVQAVVSESFTGRRLPLPALSVAQVGGLPLVGAQVVLEATAVERKAVNPHGLAFISGQAASDDNPLARLGPLVEKSLADLRAAVGAANAQPGGVLRVTCYLTALDDWIEVRRRVASEYPRAAFNIVQPQRAPSRALVECEAVARLGAPPPAPLRFANPPGLPGSRFYSQLALVGPGRLALTGTQLGFRYTEEDARLAFQRLGRTLETAGTSFDRVAMSSIYPLSASMGELVRRVRTEFYSRETPPASTMLPFEGLPSLDASFGVDVIAVMPQAAPAGPRQ